MSFLLLKKLLMTNYVVLLKHRLTNIKSNLYIFFILIPLLACQLLGMLIPKDFTVLFLRPTRGRLQTTFSCMPLWRSIIESENQRAGWNFKSNYSWDTAYVIGQKFTDVVSKGIWGHCKVLLSPVKSFRYSRTHPGE